MFEFFLTSKTTKKRNKTDCPDCLVPVGGVGVNNSIFISSNEGLDDIEFDPEFWLNYQTQSQNLPNLDAFYSAYPKSSFNGKMPASEVFELIGGEVYQLALANHYSNACAARVSRALVYSGVIIPNIPGKTFKGADGKYYFLGARKLYEWMKKTFGNPDISLNKFETGSSGEGFIDAANDKSGIYIMIPTSPSDFGASGHADFFNGQNFNDSDGYFNPKGGLFSANLWILN